MSQRVHGKRSDPPWGALTLLGLLAIATGTGLGYGVMKLRGDTAPPVDPNPAVDGVATKDAAMPALGALLQRSAQARARLDVATLEALEPELEARRRSATAAERIPLELELAQGLAQRALEAKVRTSVVPSRAEADPRTIDATTERARNLLTGLQSVAPAEIERIEARLRLANGEDVGLQNPALLLPQQADRELHFVVLARPLWEADPEAEPAEIARHGRWVAEALGNETHSSGLLDALRALALLRAGEPTRAEPVVLAMLQEVPEQPFALLLRDLSAGNIAVGANPLAMAPAATVEPPRPAGVIADEPAAPVASPPQPSPPAPTEAPTAKPSTPKRASDSPPRAPKPKPAAGDFDALLAEGCKAVRSGNASGGLEILQKAFDLKPGAAAVTLCMAEANQALGREASARALCDRVLRSSPKNKQARLLAAELEHARGNTAGAIGHYQKLLETDPGNATATAYLKKHDAL